MPNPIPTSSREAVKGRDRWKCVRCAMPGSEWHHRRTRSVRDVHQHCPCNGVWLCKACHAWVHANPFLARQSGFIVSRHNPEPGSVPVECVLRGSIVLTCDGEARDGIPQ